MSHDAKPVGGPILTRPFAILTLLFIAAAVIMGWRFAAGLGAVTALNDGYPWGLWIVFDVVVGTALACGGYAVALLAYVLNQGRYHPLVRPAILTSALGYSMAGFAVVLDVGRYWNLYKVLDPRAWNLNSVLLEVALCVMAYVGVLWVETAPAFLERWKDGQRPLLRAFAQRTLPLLNKVLLFVVALGLLLPTMHQSSLGSVLILAGAKIHGLWQTPLLPALFLVSCLTMGYGVVVLESHLASLYFDRPAETRMLGAMARPILVTALLFALVRLGDLALRGNLALVGALDLRAWLFLAELALFFVSSAALLTPAWQHRAATQFRVAMMLVAGGVLYRFDAYLVGYMPSAGWSYFPAVAEIVATVGIVALEVMGYLVIVKRFPILAGQVSATPEAAGTARQEVSP